MQEFLGPVPERVTALDPRHPVTIGPYMNDPDLINNKYQLKLAMDAARRVIPEVFAEYEALSGRRYPVVDLYRMEDADVAVLLLNSAAETAKDVADGLREQGIHAGVISPNVIRPFPVEEIQGALRRVRAVLIGERADSYGGNGANISHEVKAALKDDPANATRCVTRIYGLGGRDFYADDAEAFFELALDAAETGRVEVPFDYYGVVAGDPARPYPMVGLPPLGPQTAKGLVKVEVDEETGRPEGRGSAVLEARREPEARRAGPRRLPGLRGLPLDRRVPEGHRGRRRRPLPDRLRDGRLDRLPVHVPPGHLRAQPVPERRRDAERARGDVRGAGAARRAARRATTSPS